MLVFRLRHDWRAVLTDILIESMANCLQLVSRASETSELLRAVAVLELEHTTPSPQAKPIVKRRAMATRH
jgi:hypothetical protein